MAQLAVTVFDVPNGNRASSAAASASPVRVARQYRSQGRNELMPAALDQRADSCGARRECYSGCVATRTRPVPKIRVHRMITSRVGRVTLVREVNGRRMEREVGRRGWVSVEEAAALLERPPAAVLEAIRAGFLRARGTGRRARITVAACERFRAEEVADWALVRARRGQRTYPAAQVHAELGI